MPDAYENFNMALLMNNIVTDNEAESYLTYNDLAPASNINLLSPYSSSGSQGNMTASPMSTSSSPQYMTDYITLSDNTCRYEAVGEASIDIVVQPVDKFRFRYKSEMMGTHGALLGVAPDGNSRKKTVPSVKLNNFPDKAIIRCTLVTSDDECRIPHAHKLVKRNGTTDQEEPHDIEVSSQNNFTATFTGMGIIHTARKNIKDELVRKMRNQLLDERKRTNINANINLREDAEIKANADNYQRSMNLNSVSLCFQAFIADQYVMRPITAPVYSNPINNLKSALTGELKICRIDKHVSSCEGGEEIFILVEKVGKKNIKIKFFEVNEDDIEIWYDYARFSELDVHHQYAIVFRTPPYKDQSITSPREVFLQLERPSDSDCSEPIKFTYKPSDRMIGRKRTRISHSNSTELPQLVFNHNVNPSSNVHMVSNESSEMTREINKILDQKCSSTELREFINGIDLDTYAELLDNSEENKLTYDGPSRKQKHDKAFARNVIIDLLKRVKAEPDKDKQKDIIKTSLKDRSTYGDSPLHSALRYGQKSIAKYIFILMSTLPDFKDLVNVQNSSGQTPLHYAVTQNQADITKALLLLGANPNLSDNYGQMPLHCAVKSQETKECVDILLSAKDINLEAHTDLGWTPLHLAAETGSYFAVQSLIKAGANVNNADMSYGRTVLHIAVEGGHKDIVGFLLKNTTINVNKKNLGGNTALHNAVVTPGAKAKEICALLMNFGANPYIKNHNRETDQEEMVITPTIKYEVDSEEENIEEPSGQSSFDLASNNPDILNLVSSKHDAVLDTIDTIKKEENIDDTPEKIWLDVEQEQHLSTILDRTEGWKKLADYFNYKYLMKTFQQSSSSPSLLLLNYIAIQSDTSLEQLRSILQNISEEDAAAYMSQILSKTFMKRVLSS